MSIIQKYKTQWDEMDASFKYIMIAIFISGVVYMVFNSSQNANDAKQEQPKAKPHASSGSQDDADANLYNTPNLGVLPTNNRNQGLENLTTEISQLRNELELLKNAPKASNIDAQGVTPTRNQSAYATGNIPNSSSELDTPLPPAVKFDNSKAPQSLDNKPVSLDSNPQLDQSFQVAPPAPSNEIVSIRNKYDDQSQVVTQEQPPITIPANSALEAVMLSGINARPSGSAASGRVTSAVDVGAPFVTKIKGDAMLPNGWKVSKLGDCWMGGSGIAIISAERVNAVSDKISCVSSDGKIFEGTVKAYALDVDGIQGIAGHVVSKQGTILMQSALAGVASGLGQAVTPTTIPAYNTNSTGGTAQAQFPNPSIVAQTAVGQGVSQGANQLSKFYLDYARETFPVIEVNSGTRVTWVLKESVELRMTKKVQIK